MSSDLRPTRSVCPVCLKNLPAVLRKEADGRVVLEKTCPAHGAFRVPVWSGALDFDAWLLGERPLAEGEGLACPDGCGLCAEHESGTCCTLLEVTRRCDLRCRFCFADGGGADADPPAEALEDAMRAIVSRCGQIGRASCRERV